ncbi:hypothetical protein BJ508DRAFT_361171 [Ascobolus immersus RN42]|uniref:Uncharacterized protein n=1 Tax=Ascobolus immersus RN42 TaxID=1160509 RepID=A0A3N4IAH7_ASCIM|nr:hypothetical protein BJ508DRAFT_361171 [Ascobolus immersus RN42]
MSSQSLQLAHPSAVHPSANEVFRQAIIDRQYCKAQKHMDEPIFDPDQPAPNGDTMLHCVLKVMENDPDAWLSQELLDILMALTERCNSDTLNALEGDSGKHALAYVIEASSTRDNKWASMYDRMAEVLERLLLSAGIRGERYGFNVVSVGSGLEDLSVIEAAIEADNQSKSTTMTTAVLRRCFPPPSDSAQRGAFLRSIFEFSKKTLLHMVIERRGLLSAGSPGWTGIELLQSVLAFSRDIFKSDNSNKGASFNTLDVDGLSPFHRAMALDMDGVLSEFVKHWPDTEFGLSSHDQSLFRELGWQVNERHFFRSVHSSELESVYLKTVVPEVRKEYCFPSSNEETRITTFINIQAIAAIRWYISHVEKQYTDRESGLSSPAAEQDGLLAQLDEVHVIKAYIDQFTPLHYAVATNHDFLIQKLVHGGKADFNARWGPLQETPLQLACRHDPDNDHRSDDSARTANDGTARSNEGLGVPYGSEAEEGTDRDKENHDPQADTVDSTREQAKQLEGSAWPSKSASTSSLKDRNLNNAEIWMPLGFMKDLPEMYRSGKIGYEEVYKEIRKTLLRHTVEGPCSIATLTCNGSYAPTPIVGRLLAVARSEGVGLPSSSSEGCNFTALDRALYLNKAIVVTTLLHIWNV